VERIGYALAGANDTTMMKDVGAFLDSVLEPGDTVFDFSNTPGLFHYLHDADPGTRYYHVSIAIRRRTQRDLLESLERRRPRVVALTSDGDGRSFYVWDGIANQVRHYDVSEYLLDRYEPVANLHGFVLMLRKEEVPRTRSELLFGVPPCDWGFVPNFFAPRPEPGTTTLSLPVRAAEPVVRIRGWAIDAEATAPAVELVAAVGARVVATSRRHHERLDIGDYLSDTRFDDSGFALVVPGPVVLDANGAVSERLRVYAVSRSGTATELPRPGAAGEAPRELVRPGGRRLRVVPGVREQGYVDELTIKRPLAVTLPADGRARGYRWLELRTGEPLTEGHFELADRLDEITYAKRIIGFGALDRGETSIRVHVGSCSQWRGYRSRVLYLTSTVPQDVRGIRLLLR
jgi:hypothetical protein